MMQTGTPAFRAIVPAWYRAPIVERSLLRLATKMTGYSAVEIRGASRERTLCHVRWACMVVLRKRGLSLPQIGRQFGNRDHTTVVHGLERAAELVATDDGFAALVDALAVAK